MVGTLLRLSELRALSPALTGIAELPVARLRALLVDARTVRSQQIAQMSELRRLATLTAFCAIGVRSAQDDVLDHLETILDEVDDRARARERKRLAIAAVLDEAGVRLAEACELVLDDAVSDAELRAAILSSVGRERLQHAVWQLREHTRPVEEGHRERLLGSYPTVRRFLPLLLDTLEFHASDAGEEVLDALGALQRIEQQRKPSTSDVPLGIVSRS